MLRNPRLLACVVGLLAGLVAIAVAQDQVGAGVTVRTANHEQFGQHLVDGEGRALYVYASDPAGESTCIEACAEAWPPLIVDGELTAGPGVAGTLLSTITRADGSEQAAYNGMALYYYAEDANEGDTAGQGIGDAWYLVSPFGAAIIPPKPVDAPVTSTGDVDSAAVAALMEEGETVFSDICAACHGNRGQGISGPALAGARLDDDRRVIRQVIFGGSHMPAFGSVLSDEQIAAVVTYIRRSWGNDFRAVTPEEVMNYR